MRRILLASVSAVLLAGCVSAPPTTPQVQALNADNVGLKNDVSPVIADAWWKSFGDPQLDQLVVDALKGSPTLAVAMARAREAQALFSQSRAASDPQISGDAQEQRVHLSENYEIPAPYAGTWRWLGTAAANLSWSLDLFGKEQAQIDSARASAEAAGFDADGARLMLAGNVTTTYIQLARAYALVDAAEETVRRRERVHDMIAQRLKTGLDNPSTLKQSSTQLVQARQELLRARAERDLAVHLLAALTGKGAQGYDIARPKLNEAALALPLSLSSDLLARRPDIAAAKARVTAASAGRLAAHQAFYPDINLLGTAGWASIGLSQLLTASSTQYGGGAAIHLPIFDAGLLRAGYAGATAKLDEAEGNYNQTLVTAVRQTADAVTQLQSADAVARQQDQALADATASYELVSTRYRNGLASELSLLSAEETLIQARRQTAVVGAEKASARVSLVMALGGGFSVSGNSTKQETSHE